MIINEVDYTTVEKKLRDRQLAKSDVHKAIKADYAQQFWTEDEDHPPPHLLINTRLEDGTPLFVSLDIVSFPKGKWKCRTAFSPDKEGYYERQKQK